MKSKLRFYFFMCSLCFQDQLDFDKLYCSNLMTSMVRTEFNFKFYIEPSLYSEPSLQRQHLFPKTLPLK